jgi:hypothetical protein
MDLIITSVDKIESVHSHSPLRRVPASASFIPFRPRLVEQVQAAHVAVAAGHARHIRHLGRALGEEEETTPLGSPLDSLSLTARRRHALRRRLSPEQSALLLGRPSWCRLLAADSHRKEGFMSQWQPGQPRVWQEEVPVIGRVLSVRWF